MFLRFVTDIRDQRSHQKLGVIRAANRFYDLIGYDDWERIEALCGWLNRNLRVPRRFSRSRRPRAQKKAICWFRKSAALPLGKVCLIAHILNRYGVPTEMLVTRRPGYVVYEDRFQIAAIPFRDTAIEIISGLDPANAKSLKRLGPPQASIIS